MSGYAYMFGVCVFGQVNPLEDVEVPDGEVVKCH